MKNIDKIRTMNPEELAETIVKRKCEMCSYHIGKSKCEVPTNRRTPNHCCVGVTEWLNQEVNPLPAFEIADVIETANNRYVVIGEKTVIGVKEIFSTTIPAYICPIDDVIAHETVTTIWRCNQGTRLWEKIWRADDE